jgi:hypothetical protein
MTATLITPRACRWCPKEWCPRPDPPERWDSGTQITFTGVGLGLRAPRNGFDDRHRRRRVGELAAL